MRGNYAKNSTTPILLEYLREVTPLASEHAVNGILELAAGLPFDELSV